MADQQQPVIPAVPWYRSEVQVRAAIAIGAQLVSIVLRILGHFGLQIQVSATDVDAVVADVSQGAAVVFALLAITKRASSPLAPLTLTSKGADQRNADNPPLLPADPSKVPTTAPPGTSGGNDAIPKT